MRLYLMIVACFSIASFLVNPTQVGEEVIASKSLTVQSSGPRAGDAGSKYFYIQGKAESFSLTVDEISRGQVARGGKLCLGIVPAGGAVAATYFGTSETDKEKSPQAHAGSAVARSSANSAPFPNADRGPVTCGLVARHRAISSFSRISPSNHRNGTSYVPTAELAGVFKRSDFSGLLWS